MTSGIVPRPSIANRKSHVANSAAFTLVEMLVVVAILIIVLGLMVNLARSVRVGYATDVTKELLRKLDDAVTRYQQRTGRLPDVADLIPTNGSVDEQALRGRAIRNNTEVIAALRASGDLSGAMLGELPMTLYNNGSLRDAWGGPLVFMPRFNRLIGMALRDRPFFVSAGPDRKFLTLEDNFYSYEGVVAPDERETKPQDRK